MPTLVSPRVLDRALAYDKPGERPFWAHFGLQETGQTLIREAGVWSAVSTPTRSRLEAADNIRDPDGNLVKAYFLGGHIAHITQEIADEIEAADLGALITADPAEGGGYVLGYSEGY